MTQGASDAVLVRYWGSFFRRLDSLTMERRDGNMVRMEGYSIINLSVLVGPDGAPKFWTEPQMTRLEPKRFAVGDLIVSLLGMPQLVLTDDGDEQS